MPHRPSLPALGEVVMGKYTLVRVLGEGAMGIVFEAVHVRLGQRVAIKMMLPPALGHAQELTARFAREARAASQLQSPHVTRVLDVDELPNGTPFMVMEYLEGNDLAAELHARGPLPIQEAVTYVLQACDALTEAHRLGVVHRDIKPANIFLARIGGRRAIKVLDFGISKLPAGESSTSMTATFSTFGTPLYMSPEQMRSAKYVDARTDVWALGVVLYQLLAGRLPFNGENAMAVATSVATDTPVSLCVLRPDVPADLDRAVMAALVKSREGRVQDVQSFARLIAPFATPAAYVPPAASTSPARSVAQTAPSPVTASAWSTAARNSVLKLTQSRWAYVALPGAALLLLAIVTVYAVGGEPPDAQGLRHSAPVVSVASPMTAAAPAAISPAAGASVQPVDPPAASASVFAPALNPPVVSLPGAPAATAKPLPQTTSPVAPPRSKTANPPQKGKPPILL